MSDSKAYATPAAILLGSVIIATALYLRERPQPSPAPVVAPAPVANVPSAAPQPGPAVPAPAVPAPAVAPPQPTLSNDAARQQVSQAIEKHRALLIERCWKPSVEKQPEPGRADFVLNFGFDAAGTAVTRGIVENRTNARPGIGACVSQELPSINLPTLGQGLYIEVPLKLP
jgi:hypothetical protein